MSFKPDGYPSAAPYLVVEDAEAALGFIETVFGGETVTKLIHDDGTTIHAEAKIDDTVIMVGQAKGNGGSHVHVYVEDPEALFDKALWSGGTSVQDPVLKQDGSLRGGVKDPQGTVWWLSRHGG